MKAVVVYDSQYGNTKKVAEAVGTALGGESEVLRVGNAGLSSVKDVDLIVVGSPTHGGSPTEAIQAFLSRMEGSLPTGTRVAAFDTRLAARWVAIFGYAAPKIADALREAGGTLVAQPEGFVVRGRKGPLREGELERAADWARQLVGEA